MTDNHGHADWMPPAEAMREFPPHPAPGHGGKVIGRLPDDGRSLYDHLRSGQTGLTLEFSGSGSGKSSSLICQAARFEGPKIINDPSCEIGPMMWRYLEGRGEPVHIVSPTRPRNVPWAHCYARYNPLDWVDPTKRLASSHVRTFARNFFDEREQRGDGDNEYFRKAARTLITVILGDILWTKGVPHTLSAMRNVISLGPDRLRAYLAGVQSASPCPMARAAVGPLLNTADEAGKTFASVWDEASQATMWLTDPDLADMVSGSDFHTTDICKPDPATVIFHLPLDLQQTDPAIARVLFGSFVSAKIASGTTNWALLQPDEPWVMGKCQWMETVIGAGRKHGLAMHAPWLDAGLLQRIWGPAALSFWQSNARCVMVGQVRDAAQAKAISEACGTTAVLARSEGINSGSSAGTGLGRSTRGRNVSTHEIKRALMMPHEIIQDLKRDDLLVLGLGKPLMLKRALWWDYPDLAAMIERSPYEQAAEAPV